MMIRGRTGSVLGEVQGVISANKYRFSIIYILLEFLIF